jgi:outer membrane protein OmpA-like peptidoglycan-associated protein
MIKYAVAGLTLPLFLYAGISMSHAEEYMKRGASVEDYEQALQRTLGEKRGLVIGPERQAPGGPAVGRHHKHSGTAERAHRAQSGVYPPRDIYSSTRIAHPSNGVALYFGYDSAELTAEAMNELETLGKALRSPKFDGVFWIIEGHTDASGSAYYNLGLSERRANSAKAFLVTRFHIPPGHLLTVGRGEADLYDPTHPMASINRRVRIRPADDYK